jgi:hypothetical protein
MGRVVSLLTDFGTGDGFVGTMKGVIYSISPNAKIVDLSHDIAPQDIDGASYVIARSYPYFPKGSIHVVVVDPGVGSERRIICAACDGHFFLAPDNGILSYLFDRNEEVDVVSVTESNFFLDDMSRTFHGRDIFAPVAGNLANGVSPKRLGPGIGDYNRGHVSRPEPIENGLAGSVLYIDGFGNLMTNLNNTELDGVVKAVMIFQGTELRFVSSYYEGDPGEPVVLRGSAGFLEIAVNGGNAAEMLHAKVGTSVRLFWSQY